MQDFEIPEIEVAAVLNNNPIYRDLHVRLAALELDKRIADGTPPDAKQQPYAPERTKAELEMTVARLKTLEADTRKQIRDALRIELANEAHRLETQADIYAAQLLSFEKEVLKKRAEAESVGRTSVAAQMAKAEIDNLEQVLHAVEVERETLKVELRAAPRVRVLGEPKLPAEVSECAD